MVLSTYMSRSGVVGFLGGTSGKESACQCRRHKSCTADPWVGKIPWRRKWQPTPVLLSMENSMDREAWWTPVYGAAKSQTRLSDRAHSFLRKLHVVLHNDCINLHSHLPTVSEGSLFSTPSSAFVVCRVFNGGHSD